VRAAVKLQARLQPDNKLLQKNAPRREEAEESGAAGAAAAGAVAGSINPFLAPTLWENLLDPAGVSDAPAGAAAAVAAAAPDGVQPAAPPDAAAAGAGSGPDAAAAAAAAVVELAGGASRPPCWGLHLAGCARATKRLDVAASKPQLNFDLRSLSLLCAAGDPFPLSVVSFAGEWQLLAASEEGGPAGAQPAPLFVSWDWKAHLQKKARLAVSGG
jgi:hypothetical protein